MIIESKSEKRHQLITALGKKILVSRSQQMKLCNRNLTNAAFLARLEFNVVILILCKQICKKLDSSLKPVVIYYIKTKA